MNVRLAIPITKSRNSARWLQDGKPYVITRLNLTTLFVMSAMIWIKGICQNALTKSVKKENATAKTTMIRAKTTTIRVKMKTAAAESAAAAGAAAVSN